MPTLYRRPGSPYWWLFYRSGKQCVRKSTGIEHNGRKKPPLGSPAIEILRTVEERLARQRWGLAPLVETQPLGKFLEAYLASLEIRPASRARYESSKRAFLAWAAGAKLVTVADVTAKHAAEFVDARRAAGISSRGLTSDLSVLRTAWAEAKRRNLCSWEENPFKIRIKATAPPEPKRAFTRDEITALLRIEEPAWLPTAIRIALYTGARGHSIRHLTWGDISFDFGTIRFGTTKTTPYSVPLHPELAAYLRQVQSKAENVQSGATNPQSAAINPRFCAIQAPDASPGKGCSTRKVPFSDDAHILASGTDFSARGSDFSGHILAPDAPSWGPWVLSAAFIEAAAKVGVQGTFHQLRHTFVSLLAAGGVDKRITQALANHSSERVHAAYEHIDAADLASHLAKLRVV